MTVIVDHGTGRLVWAAEGRNKDTLAKFFDELGPDRAAMLTHVSADGAEWIHAVVTERARPRVVGCVPRQLVQRPHMRVRRGVRPHGARRQCQQRVRQWRRCDGGGGGVGTFAATHAHAGEPHAGVTR